MTLIKYLPGGSMGKIKYYDAQHIYTGTVPDMINSLYIIILLLLLINNSRLVN